MNPEWIDDLCEALELAELGTVGTNIFKSRPGKWNPEDLLVLVAPTIGTSAITGTQIDQPRFQVRTYSRRYADAWAKCHAIFSHLRQLAPTVLHARTLLHACDPVNPPVPLGQDPSMAYGFGVNFQAKIGAL